MSNTSPSSSGGIGFGGLLTVLFIGLKLAAIISWPWVWVLGPLWIPLVIACLGVLGSLLLAGTIYAIAWLVEKFT